MALHPTPENFRAEISRNMLTRIALCDLIGMHPNALTNYVNGNIPLTGWAAHNIGWAINQSVGYRVFEVNPHIGWVPAPRGRPPGVKKDTASLEPYRRKNRRRRKRN